MDDYFDPPAPLTFARWGDIDPPVPVVAPPVITTLASADAKLIWDQQWYGVKPGCLVAECSQEWARPPSDRRTTSKGWCQTDSRPTMKHRYQGGHFHLMAPECQLWLASCSFAASSTFTHNTSSWHQSINQYIIIYTYVTRFISLNEAAQK